MLSLSTRILQNLIVLRLFQVERGSTRRLCKWGSGLLVFTMAIQADGAVRLR